MENTPRLEAAVAKLARRVDASDPHVSKTEQKSAVPESRMSMVLNYFGTMVMIAMSNTLFSTICIAYTNRAEYGTINSQIGYPVSAIIYVRNTDC